MNAFDEVLSFLQEPLGTFPDRSAKWLSSNTDNLHGLLEIIGSDLVGALDFQKIRRVNTTFISEHYQTLSLSAEEASLMQSMAEHYIEQGIEQGARQTSIESTIAILNERFPQADVNALKPVLEAITDLDRLKQLNLNASLVSSFRAFQHGLEA